MASRISSNVKPVIYSNFAGLSSIMGEVSMENPEEQRLIAMDNTFNSVRGFISNEAPFVRVTDEEDSVVALKLFDRSKGSLVYASESTYGVDLKCSVTGAKLTGALPAKTPVSITLFNGEAIVVGHGHSIYKTDGYAFTPIQSEEADGARFVCTTQNRVFFAGYDKSPNRIVSTRVDKLDVFPSDEAIDEPSVLKAAFLQIDGLLGSGDRITGMGVFEANKLSIFTNDRAFVYSVDPDYTQWKIDNSIAINFGCISHNSIVTVGGELFFCSRSGVHSIRRSALNGITVFTLPLSDEITDLYQALIADVNDKQNVSSCYNPDEGRLHVFIPSKDGRSHRISVSVAPSVQESQKLKAAWSMATSTGLACGTFGSGRMFCGTKGGIVEMLPVSSKDGIRGDGSFTLPMLFQKDAFNPKMSQSLAVIAAGAGSIEVMATDETGRQLGVTLFDLPADDQATYDGVPLQRQFTRDFRHKFNGLRLKFTIKSNSLVRIYAIGVFIKEE